VSGAPLLVGDAAERLASVFPGAILSRASARPDPAIVGAIGARRFAEHTALPAEPAYLRPADVTLPGNSP